MREKEMELYVHIPFCIRKCAYCDFASAPGDETQQERYFAALEQEIAGCCEGKERLVKTVFFGGGTPTVPAAAYLARILGRLRQKFSFADDAEISLEANPGTVDREKLQSYREAGFNRISFGCQSAHDRELRRLGRIHTFSEFCESYEMARKAGFTNINVDLMSALPGQSAASWEESLRKVAQMGPEHISAYSLIIEPGTPFAQMELDLPDEETEREMYRRTGEILSEYGFHQYEISNYAREGYACRHNIGYWRRTEYLGFGTAAASLWEEKRWTNTADLAEYLKAQGNPDEIRRDREALSGEECMEEFMFLGLRMTEGISRSAFFEAFGVTLEEIYAPVIRKYAEQGMMTDDGENIALTREGISVSNVILADFLLGE